MDGIVTNNAKFALLGAAGYVAPRHMKAIKDVGGELVAAVDPFDSVGVLDSYSSDCLYFKETERFQRWLSKNPVDYVVVASPNYLHDSHCMLAMLHGADVICEKPVVLNERNLDNLLELEGKTGKRVYCVLQCRLHPQVVSAKERINAKSGYEVQVDYLTPRGKWYDHSWKSDQEKSGGLSTNIGVHLFDLGHWLFGAGKSIHASVSDRRAFGRVCYDNAFMEWRLSIEQGERERRFEIKNNGEVIRLNLVDGFNDLHTKSYQEILEGRGFGLEDARGAIRIVEGVRNGV